MLRKVYVWKESVYKNGFKCKCGNQIADENGNVHDGKMLIEDCGFRMYCYCTNCYQPVAYLRKMEIPEDAHGLMGNITEYERRKMN